MSASFDLSDDDVVVVIGSGAGGATLANELAQRGVKSVVLEAGRQVSLDDIENDEWASVAKFAWLDKRIARGDWPAAKTSPNAPVFTVKAVGGTTILWGAVAARFLPHDFRTRSTYGGIEGASLLDWPITYDELAPYYERAERKMGVGGTQASGLPELPENNHYKVLAAGARRIGYSKITRPLAINSAEYDNRPACQQIGFCQQGCKVAAKWSTLYTEIPGALATGKVELRPNSMALKIEHDKFGKVTGVLYADKHGRHNLQKARAVCLAGNSIESPRLLLNSESSRFPQGLANSSGEVGKNYMIHTTGFSFAVHQKPVYMYRGTTLAAIIADETGHRPERGFAGGYHLEGIAFGLPFAAAFMEPGGWGRAYTSVLDRYDNIACLWICGEDLPQTRNGVTLHPDEKDQYGLPVPVVSKSDHPNDSAMRAHAWRQARKIGEAVDAAQIIDTPPGVAAHNMGTCRMSANPRDGVVDRWGRAHDVPNLFISDGSQFTSSSAANPTLTIVALAIRQAEYIAEAAKRGDI